MSNRCIYGIVVIGIFYNYRNYNLWVIIRCKVNINCVIVLMFFKWFSVIMFILGNVNYLCGIGFICRVIIGIFKCFMGGVGDFVYCVVYCIKCYLLMVRVF